MESVVGAAVFGEWIKSFTNWFDPRQNVAIGVVPGCDTIKGVAKNMAPKIDQFYPIYSAIYSSYLYDKYSIPNLSLEREMDAISGKIDLQEY